MTEAPRLGVVVCQCGGNISDYVDVEKVRSEVARDPRVVASQVQMFACSDAAQQQMVAEIREKKLNGLVVCSCSPKLHQTTFRAVARRAGLNPYQYTQVNIREQCSWAHTHDRDGATGKATRLALAGVARTASSEPLEPTRVETVPQVLVLGAGVAGLRAALALSDLGISVHLVERDERPGGQVARWGTLFPNGASGAQVIDRLVDHVRHRDNIQLYLATELVEKSGRVGEFSVTLRTHSGVRIPLTVGSVVVATGFQPYDPAPGEFGYGLEGVVTLAELKERLGGGRVPSNPDGSPVRSIAYVYCVGSRDPERDGGARSYCSRYCCSATTHVASVVSEVDPSIRQYHLFRDIRTYGRNEAFYEKALRAGSVFLRYDETAPPTVEREAGGLVVRVKDRLMAGREVELRPDLVVLVTGMAPRDVAALNDVLKLPLGKDGFFHEMHIKLRPVETVVNGVYLAGAAQGPKNLAESVGSALAGVSKAGSLLLQGFVDLDPQVARVDPERCTWCGECLAACPYGAVEKVPLGEKAVARVNPVLCKGEGACVPVCPLSAVSVLGYTNEQVGSMITELAKEAA